MAVAQAATTSLTTSQSSERVARTCRATASVSVPASAITAASSRSPIDAGTPDRFVRGLEQRVDRPAGADGVFVARPPLPEMERPALEVEQRGERLRRATVDPEHEARVRAATAPIGGRPDADVSSTATASRRGQLRR